MSAKIASRLSKYVYTNMPICKTCGHPYGAWITRSPWVRTLLFWLPIKRFACYRCGKTRHLLK